MLYEWRVCTSIGDDGAIPENDRGDKMIDIYSKGEYPANELSNFAYHPFIMDGVQINSMEGFLQSLKYISPKKQKDICLLSGKEAKRAGGRKILWRLSQTTFWQGKKMHLLSDELQMLIERAYDEMYKQNEDFRKALANTENEQLIHTIGKTRADKTMLTQHKFIGNLERLRMKYE